MNGVASHARSNAASPSARPAHLPEGATCATELIVTLNTLVIVLERYYSRNIKVIEV